MATFYINGAEVTVAKKQKLLRYLRDELHLTSVKDGCSEGACGACTVLINGEPCRACVPDTERLDGKHILTVEGLSDFERAAYTFAFGEAGAVQCGFCIPGMVLCAKALLDRTPDPTEEQIRWAIRNNYCRCTGYVKIVEAIRLAGKILREKKIPLPRRTGRSAPASSVWTSRRRSSAPENIPTITTPKKCATAPPCAANIRAPACCPSTRPRRPRCPALSAC